MMMQQLTSERCRVWWVRSRYTYLSTLLLLLSYAEPKERHQEGEKWIRKHCETMLGGSFSYVLYFVKMFEL